MTKFFQPSSICHSERSEGAEFDETPRRQSLTFVRNDSRRRPESNEGDSSQARNDKMIVSI